MKSVEKLSKAYSAKNGCGSGGGNRTENLDIYLYFPNHKFINIETFLGIIWNIVLRFGEKKLKCTDLTKNLAQEKQVSPIVRNYLRNIFSLSTVA